MELERVIQNAIEFFSSDEEGSYIYSDEYIDQELELYGIEPQYDYDYDL